MVKNLLGTIFAMGLDKRAVKDISYLDNYDKHIDVALQTAREGIVLLKNDNKTLPFKAGKNDVILITGEYVDELAVGSGAAYVDGFDRVTLLEALRKQFKENVKHVINPSDQEIKNATLVLYTVSTKDSEGSDISFDLAGKTNMTINNIANQNSKTVVIMYAGGGRNMTAWSDEVAAILYSWYPGQIGNHALAEIIAGVTNPSGKIPITIERDFKDSPGYSYLPEGEELYTGWDYDLDLEYPVYDINYEEGVFTGYRWYEYKNIQPLYAFGHGLSYSSFEYNNLKTNANTYSVDDDVMVKVDIGNTGDIGGKEIVQLYVRDLEASVERPLKELKDFQKIHLEPGETKTVYFTLIKRDFSFWDESQSAWQLEPGEFEILVGTSSAKIYQKVVISILNHD